MCFVGLAAKGLRTQIITEKASFFSKGISEQIGPLYRQFQLFWMLLPPDFCKSCCKLKFSPHKPLVKKQNM